LVSGIEFRIYRGVHPESNLVFLTLKCDIWYVAIFLW